MIGAGIVGVSVAEALARRGCKVRVVDRLPYAKGKATPASWAWINANSKKPKSYQDFNMLVHATLNRPFQLPPGIPLVLTTDSHVRAAVPQAMRTWDALHPGAVSWCGTLLICGVEPQEQPDYAVEQVSAARASELEPGLDARFLAHNAHQLLHFAQEGLVDPERAVEMIAAKAEQLGVEFLHRVEVLELRTCGGIVTGVAGRCANGEDVLVDGDVVVLANGTGVEELARTAGRSQWLTTA